MRNWVSTMRNIAHCTVYSQFSSYYTILMIIQQENLVYKPVSSNPAAQQPPPALPPADIPPQDPPPESLPEESGLPLKSLLIRIGIGVGIFVVILLLVFLVILPFFRGKQPEGPVTLTYWGLWEDSRVMNTLIADFERQNPNIKVKYSKMDSKQYRDRLVTRIVNGTGPDIYRFHNSWVPMLLKNNAIMPLSTDAITPDEFRKIYYPVTQTDLIQQGALYGIPLQIDTLAMFVNPSILQSVGMEVPKNWNDFLKVVREVTTSTEEGEIKTAGAGLGAYDNITHAPDIISMLLLQSGVNIADLSQTPEKATEALQFYTEFITNPPPVWDTRLDSSQKLFAEEKLGIYFGYSWDIFMLRALNNNLSFSVHPVPALGREPTTVASYWVEGVSSQTKHSKEAMLFMHFLTQKETSQKFYTEVVKSGREFGELPARRDLADSLKGNTVIYPFLELAPFAKSSVFMSDTEDGDTGINTLMNKYLANAINSIIGDENTSVSSAVDTLVQGAASVMSEYAQ